jgi:hypothetical protein
VGQFILHYTGKGAAPAADLTAIRGQTGVRVLDTSDRMVLVEAAEDAVRALAGELGWEVVPRRTYPVPDARPRLRRPAE